VHICDGTSYLINIVLIFSVLYIWVFISSGFLAIGVNLDSLVFSFEGRYSKNDICQTMIDLELDSKEEEATTHRPSSSIEMKLSLPKDPPSVETALKTLSTALNF